MTPKLHQHIFTNIHFVVLLHAAWHSLGHVGPRKNSNLTKAWEKRQHVPHQIINQPGAERRLVLRQYDVRACSAFQ